jgi:uncharacterized membrane protein YsdA (DUF1294 family)
MYWYLYWIWLAAANIITFVLFGIDKAQSKVGGWRVPEVSLHLLALSGGFAGGWTGRSIFHHKTKKGIFIFVLSVSTVIHLVLVLWLLFR